MADALSLQQRVERGREASRLLNEPLLKDAFVGVEEGIVAQWRAAEDTETRERLWAGLHAARRVETWLRATQDDGAIAQAEIDHQNREYHVRD